MLFNEAMDRDQKIALLLKILSDKSCALAERDDAAIELGAFDEDEVLTALVRVASDKDERHFIASSAAESIAEILLRKNVLEPDFLSQLRKDAAKELAENLAANMPSLMPKK
jgi:HEAT repeat protein